MLESHEIENFPSPPLQSEGAPSRYAAAQASARALVEQIKDASHQHKQDTAAFTATSSSATSF